MVPAVALTAVKVARTLAEPLGVCDPWPPPGSLWPGPRAWADAASTSAVKRGMTSLRMAALPDDFGFIASFASITSQLDAHCRTRRRRRERVFPVAVRGNRRRTR